MCTYLKDADVAGQRSPRAVGRVRLGSSKLSLLMWSLALLLIAGCSGPGTQSSAVAAKSEILVDRGAVALHLKEARQAMDAGDTKAADLAFQRMMNAGARSVSSLNWYAIFLREQWRMLEAEAVYKKALSHSPQSALTHWNMAVLYELYLGRFDLAIEHFEAYQRFAIEPDARVDAWVADLQRRQSKRTESSES